MSRLRALIVDDEDLARENLRMMVDEFCPEIEVVGTAGSVAAARLALAEKEPDVVFLDIRMPSGAEGFQLLEEIPKRRFLVVFVTAFKEYAVKAFNANATHYVLKPIDIDDLRLAVEKLLQVHQTFQQEPDAFKSYLATLDQLSANLLDHEKIKRITVFHAKGFRIVEDHELMHLEGSSNYCTLYFKNGEQMVDSRTLKTYEELLDPSTFFRIHRSHIINLNELREYLHEDGHIAVLKSGKQVPISRARLSEFLALVQSR